jgi:hypothetical protein
MEKQLEEGTRSGGRIEEQLEESI